MRLIGTLFRSWSIALSLAKVILAFFSAPSAFPVSKRSFRDLTEAGTVGGSSIGWSSIASEEGKKEKEKDLKREKQKEREKKMKNKKDNEGRKEERE